ncbi:unnamed protein product [Rotaria socialis]
MNIIVLLFIFILEFKIVASSDDCYYYSSHLGKMCNNSDNSGYACYLPHDICHNGECSPRDVTCPSQSLSFENDCLYWCWSFYCLSYLFTCCCRILAS